MKPLGSFGIPKVKIWRSKALVGKGGAMQTLSQGKTSSVIQEMSKSCTSLKNKVIEFSFLLSKNYLTLAW